MENFTTGQLQELMQKCNKELTKRKQKQNKINIMYTCPHCKNKYSYNSFYRHTQTKRYLYWLENKQNNETENKINEKLNNLTTVQTLETLNNEIKEIEMLNNELKNNDN
jgi:histidinol phosphatase-like enzyme